MFYIALVVLKINAILLSFLPLTLFRLLGRALGAMIERIGFRTEVVEANLSLAYPNSSAEEKADLASAQYQSLGKLFLEFFRSFYRFDRFLEKHSDLEGQEHLKKALAEGRGVFVMTAHLGNWEILSISGPAFFQTPVTMVTKELKPRWVHRLAESTRGLLGVKMACEPKTMPTIMRALKRKEIVGFVMDQYAGAPVGARVPFFGKPVGSHTALATLALRTKAPVVPAIAVRKPNGRFLIRFEPAFSLLEADEQELAVLRNTALYVSHTEKWIREFPEQWIWVHRRWKGDLSPLPPQIIGEILR